jgi:hypothetical protein
MTAQAPRTATHHEDEVPPPPDLHAAIRAARERERAGKTVAGTGAEILWREMEERHAREWGE